MSSNYHPQTKIENKYLKIFHIWTTLNNKNPDYLLQYRTKTISFWELCKAHFDKFLGFVWVINFCHLLETKPRNWYFLIWFSMSDVNHAFLHVVYCALYWGERITENFSNHSLINKWEISCFCAFLEVCIYLVSQAE